MAPTAEGPDSSFPEFPVNAYFCWGADPPVAPHGKLSRCFASGSANELLFVVADGSDAHFLCRGIFSFTASFVEHLCPAAGDSRASIVVKLFCELGEGGERGWWGSWVLKGLQGPKATRHHS